MLKLAMLATLFLPISAGAADFHWANDGDAGAMDPYTRNETVQLSFLSNIYEPLVRRDYNLHLEPGLATSWEQPGPTTWRFHLRAGVKWQDGTPFTADDVVFSATRVKNTNSVLSDTLARVTSVKKIDDLTVDFETNGPDPILTNEITSWFIMSKAWCEAHDAVAPVSSTLETENFAVRNAMGTGPFRLVLREPDRQTIVERNPTWWDVPQHNLDRVTFSVIAQAPTRTAALLSGNVDMVYNVPPQDVDRLKATPGIHVVEGPELRTIYITMDQNRDELLHSSVKGKNPLKDERVRRAFLLAIDEPAIASRVMRGQAHPSFVMWGPGVNGYDPKLETRPAVDLARAKALLAEAGYPNGFMLGMDCSNDRYVNDAAICTAVSSMLARIGVTVEVNAQTKGKFFAQVNYPNYGGTMMLNGWTPSTYDAGNVLFSIMHGRGGGYGITNNGGVNDPDLNRLTDEIGSELDAARRQTLISQAAKIQQDHVYTIPLHQQTIIWAARSNIDMKQLADNYFPLRYVHVN